MPDTLGNLVDKLSIVNLKLWAVQDTVHKAAGTGKGVDADTVQKLVSLNLERNRLIREVDEALNSAAQAGKAPVDARVKIL